MRRFLRKPNRVQKNSSADFPVAKRMTAKPGAQANSLLRLQRALGNQAVLRILQRADAETTDKGPLALSKELVAENPTTPKECATWILKAAEQGFVTFNTNSAKQNLQDIKDAKKVEKLDPAAKDYAVPILGVEVGLVKKKMQRWIDANGAGEKPSIEYGSMIRSKGSHGTGEAIDINKLAMTTSVDATVQILGDLDKSIHASYSLGMPFQGDFFDPADEIEAKKRAAEKEAGNDVQTISVADALVKFSTHTYTATATKAADNTWKWGKAVSQGNSGAYKHLKSKALKQKIEERRDDGLKLLIFPDNDNHLHIEMD